MRAREVIPRVRTGEAEVHRFEDRLFVTAPWPPEWGVELPATVDSRELGQRVHKALRRKQGSSMDRFRSDDRAQGRKLVRFERWTRNVPGVPRRRYRPEIRVRAFAPGVAFGDGAIRISLFNTGVVDEREGTLLPAAASAEQIGEAVLHVLRTAHPQWPVVARVTVQTEPAGSWIVYPWRGIFACAPVELVDPGSDGHRLAEVLDKALQRSADEDDEPAGVDTREAALAALGLDYRDLLGGVEVHVERTSRGAIRVTGHDS